MTAEDSPERDRWVAVEVSARLWIDNKRNWRKWERSMFGRWFLARVKRHFTGEVKTSGQHIL